MRKELNWKLRTLLSILLMAFAFFGACLVLYLVLSLRSDLESFMGQDCLDEITDFQFLELQKKSYKNFIAIIKITLLANFIFALLYNLTVFTHYSTMKKRRRRNFQERDLVSSHFLRREEIERESFGSYSEHDNDSAFL